MNIILLENIRGLGQLGEAVDVKPGYGRNFLIPQGKAVPATEENVKYFEERRAELEAKSADSLKVAQDRAEKFNDLTITIAARAGDEGKLFGSIGSQDIADAATEAGAQLERKEVRLPTGAIRSTGEFEIAIHLHPEVDGTLKLVVVADA
ncbi:MAG: 50S ribosomal protein L9 [Pseudomonadota bacterium]